jgi:DNA-binding GntR family transcriptional regulator
MRDRSTLGGQVYEQLRAAILSGRLQPGQRLKVADLSAEHGVSLNVVREALNRLTGEQLVTTEPQVGFAVKNLSLDDFGDLVRVRIAIESTALRWSIENGDIAWQSKVVAAHYLLDNTPMTAPDRPQQLTYEWIRAHSSFHATLLSASGSPRMEAVTRSLSDAAELYRRWSLPLAERNLPGEHADLMKAALAREPDSAVAALTQHISRTHHTLIENQAHLTVS